ncbi:MAG: PKD domain-containing protein [Methanobacteriota archaeon]|nr:MAG: PKD domain-containing protein [Euryarchaeota archaeon]
MIREKRIGLSVALCAMLMLTGILAVVGNSSAKPTTAYGYVYFEDENGLWVNSYVVGETMYINVMGVAGSGSNPEFIYRLYGPADNDHWDVEVWYTSNLYEIVTFQTSGFCPSGQWKAVLSYTDSDLNNEIRLGFDTVELIGNEAPVAVIDEISPNPAEEGQTVEFTGHGYDPDGYIVSYRWTSSIDGLIGSGTTVYSSDLSPGTHKIWFTATDNYGLEGGAFDWLEIVVDDFATVEGTVRGQMYALDTYLLSGAVVTAKQETSPGSYTGVVYTATSNANGVYSMTVLSDWSYHFIVTYHDHAEWDRHDYVDTDMVKNPTLKCQWRECPPLEGDRVPGGNGYYWEYEIRVFERDVDGNGRADSVNLFLDANHFWQSELGIPVTEYDETKAAFWIELQGFVFADDYTYYDPWPDIPVFPNVARTDYGYYGDDQRMVLHATINVAYQESIVCPETDYQAEHTIIAEDLRLQGKWNNHGTPYPAFCAAGPTSSDRQSDLTEFNTPDVVTVDDWPDVGDGTGIYDQMVTDGYPNTEFSREYAVADLNSWPTDDCYLRFSGEYELTIRGWLDDNLVERYWVSAYQSSYFGFVFDGVHVFDDDFDAGDHDGWDIQGDYVVVDDDPATVIDCRSLKVSRGGVRAPAVATIYFGERYGHVTVQADMKIAEATGYFQYFYVGSGTFLARLTFAFYYSDSTLWFAYYSDTTGWNKFTSFPVQVGVSYSIKFEIDVPNDEFDIYVDRTLLTTNGPVPLRGDPNAYSSIDSLSFWAGWDGYDVTLWADNVWVASHY